MQVRRRIDVSGIVQGVGFRPYVFRLAREGQLVGSVFNTSSGVTIELQGRDNAVHEFLEHLPKEAPPLARITKISVCELPCNDDREFSILGSKRSATVRTPITPDSAVCSDCLNELFDPANRRYKYPFINCTNCGPRFTIIGGLPYDRPLTSMASFDMCPECRLEYDDPGNRRFHAQPNACWKCGPQVELWTPLGELSSSEPLVESARLLHRGHIAAIKGIGGFHLAVDATNADAVQRLRARKHRLEKPLAVMVADLAVAKELCKVDDLALRTLESSERPIVLLGKRAGSGVADNVAPGQGNLGVFLPYAPLHHLLFREGGFRALVMTSANLSEEPIAIENREAVQRLRGIADAFLVHNRDILWRCDDSVVRRHTAKVCQVRRSRGYVPVPIPLGHDVPSILAVGGELKNTICLTKGRESFLSQHIGDLENCETYGFFKDVIGHLEAVLEIEPAIIAHDLHPDYLSTQWALAQTGVKRIPVQHHHAHIASCMAENRLNGRVIGFAFDGTGFGTDGRIWGGEAFVADYQSFDRVAHFDYVFMPGGSQSIRQPWRMAIAYLTHHYGANADFFRASVPSVRRLDPKAVQVLLQMMERGVNCPQTSSCGRLFDAVASLIGIRNEVTYEGQAAIELEAALPDAPDEAFYPFELRPDGVGWIIDTRGVFDSILADLRKDTPSGIISARFHRGLVEVLVRLAKRVQGASDLDRVCLSGGTFHNVFLFENLIARLQEAGFRVFTHSEVPAGDGGLSLGQAMIAAHKAV
jgi:hydrogenase maturation protein HypF